MKKNSLILTLTLLLFLLGACSVIPDSHNTEKNTKEGSVTIQEGAPYPADTDHLKEILALTKAHELPNGATDITVRPALKFASSYPGGWGYVISFRAKDQAIRAYIDEYTDVTGHNVEIHQDSKPNPQFEDIDITAIEHPLVIGFGNAQLALERPLGRCWLLIRGAPR